MMAGHERSQRARIDTMDGSALRIAFASGAAWLGDNKGIVDSLNVFPVPDGDTGTNMFLTVSSALKEAQKSASSDIGVIADAISLGALMGARGNSGVIFSQLMRGFAKRLHGVKAASGADIAAALVEASNMAYKAVIKPVEGTILTVSRMSARGAVHASRDGADIIGILEEAIKQGEITLARTPEMLPTLKEAGVVDAGGKGFLIFFEGFLSAVKGEPVSAVSAGVAGGRPHDATGAQPHAQQPVRTQAVSSAPASASAPTLAATPAAGADKGQTGVSTTAEARQAREHIEFKYCTELIVKGERLDPDAMKAAILGAIQGDSALIVGNEHTVKVHIHTNFPGRVLETCIRYGSLHEIDINNMEDQHEEFEARAEAAEGGTGTAGAAGASMPSTLASASASGAADAGVMPSPGSAAAGPAAPPQPRKNLGVVAVAAGDGIDMVLRSLGADVVVTGGQTMNPSIQDIAEAARATNADSVIVLPNNGNVILTAGKASEVPDVSDIAIGVVPTKTVPQGIAALLALNPGASMRENIAHMTEVSGRVKTGEVTYAVRDSAYNGLVIKENDIIGLFDGELKAVGSSREQVVDELVAAMYAESDEVATVFYGAGVSAEEAEAIVAGLEQKYPDMEFEVRYGGQPLYYYLISLE